MKNKDCKKVYKYYKKALNSYNKNSMIDFESVLNHFISYLRYLRDISILNTQFELLDNDVDVASLCVTLAEYNNYKACINNYYTISNGIAVQIDAESSPEEVNEKYQKEKNLHLNAFWNLVKINMEGWLEKYGNTI